MKATAINAVAKTISQKAELEFGFWWYLITISPLLTLKPIPDLRNNILRQVLLY